jgi:hypothetical protein
LGFWEFGRRRVWVKGWDRGGQFTSNLRPKWTDPPLSQLGGFQVSTAGAVSIATTHRKRFGIKIEIYPLTNMIETSGFFLYTHICSSNVSERRRSDIFNRFLDM